MQSRGAAIALLPLAAAAVCLSATASSGSTEFGHDRSDHARVQVVDGVMRFHGTDGKDVITYGQYNLVRVSTAT